MKAKLLSSVRIAMSDDTRIGASEFGQYHYDRFLYWSFGDRKSKAALLRDLAVARTDGNLELIDAKLDEYARLYGLTVDDLKALIKEADQTGMSVPKLHKQLQDERDKGK